MWWYFNTTGGFLTGNLRPDREGRYLVEGVNHGSVQQVSQVRGTLEIGEGHWSPTSLALKDGEWREQSRLDFEPAD